MNWFSERGVATAAPDGGRRLGHIDFESGELLIDLSRVNHGGAYVATSGLAGGSFKVILPNGQTGTCCVDGGAGGDLVIRPGTGGAAGACCSCAGRAGTLVIRNKADTSHGVPDFDCCGCASFPIGAIGRKTSSGCGNVAGEVLVVKVA